MRGYRSTLSKHLGQLVYVSMSKHTLPYFTFSLALLPSSTSVTEDYSLSKGGLSKGLLNPKQAVFHQITLLLLTGSHIAQVSFHLGDTSKHIPNAEVILHPSCMSLLHPST